MLAITGFSERDVDDMEHISFSLYSVERYVWGRGEGDGKEGLN